MVSDKVEKIIIDGLRNHLPVRNIINNTSFPGRSREEADRQALQILSLYKDDSTREALIAHEEAEKEEKKYLG